MFFTYVLQSDKNRYYTGHTSNLEKRLSEHNDGMTKSTKSASSWKVIYSKEFQTRSEAMQHEKWLKTGVGREFLKRFKN